MAKRTAGSRRLPIIAGGAGAAVIVTGVMFFMLRGGSDDPAGTQDQGRQPVTPAIIVTALPTVTAAATVTTVGTPAQTPSPTPGATPSPTPTPSPFVPARPAVVAEIPLDRATSDAGRAVITTLNAANRAQVIAFRDVSREPLIAFFADSALEGIDAQLAGLRRLGRYGISDLVTIELLELSFTDAVRARVVTRERQRYDEFFAGTDRPVPDQNVHIDTTYRWTYVMERRDGRWLITTQNFE